MKKNNVQERSGPVHSQCVLWLWDLAMAFLSPVLRFLFTTPGCFLQSWDYYQNDISLGRYDTDSSLNSTIIKYPAWKDQIRFCRISDRVSFWGQSLGKSSMLGIYICSSILLYSIPCSVSKVVRSSPGKVFLVDINENLYSAYEIQLHLLKVTFQLLKTLTK